jgi:histidinol-phosphate aminotransferase
MTTAVVVGLGCRPGVGRDEILGLIAAALAEAGLPANAIAQLSTVDSRAAEPGVLAAAQGLGIALVTYPAEQLDVVEVPHPSPMVRHAVGTASVAEAAALAGGGEIIVPKRKSELATVAIATLPATFDLSHHGDSEVGDGLVDLTVNVRADAPPAWLRAHLVAALDDISAYPKTTEARTAVAARHGRRPEEVLLTAGAAEAFVLLARTTTARRIVVVHPQFTEPEAAMLAAGHQAERVILDASKGFTLYPAAIPDDADLVMVGNPTNPTSVLHRADLLLRLAKPGRMLVVDEAFADTVPGEPESLAGLGLPGLVVLRSLTKTWGLAGLRAGYLLASPDIVSTLERAQPLWSVSTLAAVAAAVCSTPAAVAEARQAAVMLADHRSYLVDELRALDGVFVPVEPASSFVLIRVVNGLRVRERLRERGFAVRRGDTFPGLGPDWLRIAVRDPATTEAFVKVLAEVL